MSYILQWFDGNPVVGCDWRLEHRLLCHVHVWNTTGLHSYSSSRLIQAALWLYALPLSSQLYVSPALCSTFVSQFYLNTSMLYPASPLSNQYYCILIKHYNTEWFNLGYVFMKKSLKLVISVKLRYSHTNNTPTFWTIFTNSRPNQNKVPCLIKIKAKIKKYLPLSTIYCHHQTSKKNDCDGMCYNHKVHISWARIGQAGGSGGIINLYFAGSSSHK